MTVSKKKTIEKELTADSLQLALDTREMLAQFVVRKMKLARTKDDAAEFVAYELIASLLSDQTAGIMIAKLYNDIECQPENSQADISKVDTAKISSVVS